MGTDHQLIYLVAPLSPVVALLSPAAAAASAVVVAVVVEGRMEEDGKAS